MIEATISGTLRGLATERTTASGALRVTAQLYVATRGGLAVDVNVTAYGTQGAALLRFAGGDGVEVTGTIEPRVRMDDRDNPKFLFDVTAWSVKRLSTGSPPE